MVNKGYPEKWNQLTMGNFGSLYNGCRMCLAIPGRILDTTSDGDSRIARVQFGGVTRQVHLDFVPEAAIGDYVLVHVGFAISRIDEEEAERTLALLREMGEVP
jgi:hydrogenase expression/formation protein HypC